MKTFSILLSVLLPQLACAAEVKPNFIVILADDLGWGSTSVKVDPDLSESKSDFFQTPNLERLAASGMRFSQAYAPHCNCSPSRASIQTGRSPAALHLTDIVERKGGLAEPQNKLVPPRHVAKLQTSETTIAELLKNSGAGYRTAHFGKWHLKGGGPAAHGYDVSDGPTGNGEGSRKGNLPEDPKQAFSITSRAIDFLTKEAAADHPFYLQVSHYAPHLRVQSRPATRARFKKMPKGTRHTNVGFAAMLSDMDTAVGQLLDAVDKAGIADHTYIIFTSDNGGNPTKDPSNINGPIHGWKASLWEGGVRVPFLIAGPGVKPGTTSRRPIIGWDILPTIGDLAGVKKLPEAVEGGSIRAIIQGEESAMVDRPGDSLIFHWPHYQNAKGSTPDSTILHKGWKLHHWRETGKLQLFHLDEDLAEKKDLAGAEREHAENLDQKLTSYLTRIKAQHARPKTPAEEQ